MLRCIPVICLALFIFSSCSLSKEARRYKQSLNGTWVLETIVAEGLTAKPKTQILGEADFNCFIGSSWTFNRFSNLGSYSIVRNGDECAALMRNIRWSINEDKGQSPALQYKRLDDKYKEMDTSEAYRFSILAANDSTIKLRNEIQFEGKNAALIYNFVKAPKK